MNRIILIDEIQFPSTLKHTLTKPKKVFPFLTKNTAQIKGNFNIVISDLARSITNYRINSKVLDEVQFQHVEGANKLSEFIANSENIDFQDDAAKVDFIRFIDTYLFDEENIKIVHTYLYNFIGESQSNQSVLRNLSEFIKDVFIAQDEQIEAVFKDKTTDDILTKLIINEVEKLVDIKTKNYEKSYSDLLPFMTNAFREDLKFLMKYKDYFISNFEILLNYYSFMYSIQCLLQFEKFNKGNYEKASPLYFALEWEAVTKKRPVASGASSYKIVKDTASNLFAHEYILRLLSHNIFNPVDKGKEVVGYSTLINKIESHGPDYIDQFTKDLQDLVQLYANWHPKHKEPLVMEKTIEELLVQLFNLVKEKMHDDAQVKFGQSIDYLGQGTFLKSRGSLGNLLNMSHDFLILMTSIIVKDQRMPFKTLLEEFEKRGIKFDRYSIEEIITLFNNHNILDKKSDSGDVQYVKPIL